MASVRGILNIQSLNELTYEKSYYDPRSPRLLRRGRARAEYKLVIVELHVRSECTAASASSVSLRIVALPAADVASRVNGPTFTAPPGGRRSVLMSGPTRNGGPSASRHAVGGRTVSTCQ
jgi:hypothetical protein